MTFTAEEKYREALRELRMRQQLYPRWIETGKMTQTDARRKIELMDEIAADYEVQARQGQLL